jgi:hypothetical protein
MILLNSQRGHKKQDLSLSYQQEVYGGVFRAIERTARILTKNLV